MHLYEFGFFFFLTESEFGCLRFLGLNSGSSTVVVNDFSKGNGFVFSISFCVTAAVVALEQGSRIMMLLLIYTSGTPAILRRWDRKLVSLVATQ